MIIVYALIFLLFFGLGYATFSVQKPKIRYVSIRKFNKESFKDNGLTVVDGKAASIVMDKQMLSKHKKWIKSGKIKRQDLTQLGVIDRQEYVHDMPKYNTTHIIAFRHCLTDEDLSLIFKGTSLLNYGINLETGYFPNDTDKSENVKFLMNLLHQHQFKYFEMYNITYKRRRLSLDDFERLFDYLVNSIHHRFKYSVELIGNNGVSKVYIKIYDLTTQQQLFTAIIDN